jgi:hypothetical protein
MEQVIQSEINQKLAFAKAILRNPDCFAAALSVVADTGKALQIANQWPSDPIVVAEKIRIVEEEGPRSLLPTKEEQAADIYKMATDSKLAEEDRLKAHRLYAEVMGHIEKPAVDNSTKIVAQSVMIVKDHGDDKDWEQRTVEQQRTLTAHAAN